MNRQEVASIPIREFPLWEKMASLNSIFSLELELTARCNCRCRHCYINVHAADQAARSKELNPAQISRIADQAVELGALWCLITGGEPLLREDFGQIYLDLKKKGLLIALFTNAQLISDEHVELFRRYPPRDIEITVYGVTRETYEAVTRNPGSFAKFSDGLDRLLRAGVKVRLKAMAMRSNVAELPEIARFCRAHTKDNFRFDPFLHLRFDRDPARNEEIRAERLTPSEIVVLEQGDEERATRLRMQCGEIMSPEPAHKGCTHLFHCGAGSGSFYVSHDGKFRLCCSLCDEECMYDLRNGVLADAWNRFVPKVREMGSLDGKFLESCHRCPIAALCMWCPAHAHLETGKLDGEVPYFCEVAHARARALGFSQTNKNYSKGTPVLP